jgi:hypothetical protein
MRLYLILRGLWIALIVLVSAPISAPAATRHVVMLFDERPELPGLAAMSNELERTLAASSEDRFQFYREAMDLSRFGSKTHESVLRDALRAKYAGKKIDVVVAFYPGALDFLLTHGSEIFSRRRR